MINIVLSAQAATRKQIAEGQALIEQIQQKMNNVVDEFAAGDLNREQFHKIYERYQQQIILATQLIAEADYSLNAELTPGETMVIRKELTAKSVAMAVYYHATGLMLETIGNFDVPVSHLSPILNNLSDRVQGCLGTEPQIRAINGKYLLFTVGRFSTSIMVFSHEPAPRQISIIENMHHHFETANESALRSGHADARNLVYTFLALVRKSVGAK